MFAMRFTSRLRISPIKRIVRGSYSVWRPNEPSLKVRQSQPTVSLQLSKGLHFPGVGLTTIPEFTIRGFVLSVKRTI